MQLETIPGIACGAYICNTGLLKFSILIKDAECDNKCLNTDIFESFELCQNNYDYKSCYDWTYSNGNLSAYITSNNATNKCDGNCDCEYCEDEYMCDDYSPAGFICISLFFGDEIFVSPTQICDGFVSCSKGEDEDNCAITNSTRTCKFANYKTRVLNDLNSCSVPFRSIGTVFQPLLVCSNYRDQVNCTNMAAPITCQVENYVSNVSYHMLCKNIQVCDDNIENQCITLEGNCLVHKHQLCDNITDCTGGEDERNCKYLSKVQCVRQVSYSKDLTQIPLYWIGDGVKDCVNGKDENPEQWQKTCGKGDFIKYVSNEIDCHIFTKFKCYDSDATLDLSELCSKHTSNARNAIQSTSNLYLSAGSCNSAKNVCTQSRVQLQRNKVVRLNHNPFHVKLLYCLNGLTSLQQLLPNCTKMVFLSPDEPIFGVQQTILHLPTTGQVDCRHVYGELYVYLACSDRCISSKCPLNKIVYNSCKGNIDKRIRSLAKNSYVTVVSKIRHESNFRTQSFDYTSNLFSCGNGNCVTYDQVCNLADDCGDNSDEENCTNHYRCEHSREYIYLTKVCDKILDCNDFSDECNEECTTNIIADTSLWIYTWVIAILSGLANGFVICYSLKQITGITTSRQLQNKILIILISIGDLLTGMYLLGISIIETKFTYFMNSPLYYCKNRYEWLTGVGCSSLGVLNMMGSEISLFSMTLLSVIRTMNVGKMYKSSDIDRMCIIKITIKVIIILFLSALIALIPLLATLENFFINGLRHDNIPIFVGAPTKTQHLTILQEYYGPFINLFSHISWKSIINLVGGMFTTEYGGISNRRLQFYGNHGVCLFKYFVTKNDPQKLFTWIILSLNVLCVIIIAVSYVRIYCISKPPPIIKSQNNNLMNLRKKSHIKMKRKISIIILTDLLCWIPFIIICVCHSVELLDATQLYVYCSLIILPINAVINPLIYEEKLWLIFVYIWKRITMLMTYLKTKMCTSKQEIPQNNKNDRTTEMKDIEMKVRNKTGNQAA